MEFLVEVLFLDVELPGFFVFRNFDLLDDSTSNFSRLFRSSETMEKAVEEEKDLVVKERNIFNPWQFLVKVSFLVKQLLF
jgi:hypothetical protein